MMMEELSGHILIIHNYNDIPRAQKCSSAPHVARQKGFQGRCGARATPGPGEFIVFCDGNLPKKIMDLEKIPKKKRWRNLRYFKQLIYYTNTSDANENHFTLKNYIQHLNTN
jgi:hypothetical protein